MIQRIKKRNELVKKDYDLICQAVPSIKDAISFDEFHHGKILASSRAYDLAFTDGTTRQVIIPFIELSLINYGDKKNVNCMQVDGQLKLRACRDIKRGELIIQQQASACNSSIFLNSGYLAEENHERNSVYVEASLDQEDPQFAAKLELISQSDPMQKFIIRENLTIRDTYELISWLRYIVYDEEQAYLILAKTQAVNQAKENYLKRGGNLAEFKDNGFFKAREITPISVRNERAALKKLVSVCLSMLCNYSTSYKEDLELLEKDSKDHLLSVNERNCVKLRSGEKRILHFMIDNA